MVISFRENILREAIRLAIKQVPSMQLTSLGVAFVLSYSVRNIDSPVNIISWLLMILAIAVCRIVFYYRFQKIKDGAFDGKRWQHVYLISAFVSGIIWGSSAFFIFPAGEIKLISLFIIVIASLSAATTVSHSSIRFAPAAWSLPALLPYAVRCFSDAGEFEYTLGVMIILYLFAIIYYSFSHNRSIISAVAMKFENTELLDRLKLINDELNRDISERKKAEQMNVLLASIVESSDNAIIGKTLDGVITSWNHGAERIYGYTAAEVMGRNISLIVPPGHQGQVADIMDRIIKGEQVDHIDVQRVRKDGRIIYVSLTSSPIKDADGRIVGVSSIALDVTDQKTAEAELRKLSRAVQASPATVLITDTLGNIEYVNPKFTEVTGYSFDESIGKNPRILKSGEKSSEEYKELWDTITAGGEWRGVFHNKKKNGELYWESASISPIRDKTGNITNYIAVKEDITSLKEVQDKLATLSLVASKTDNVVIITDDRGRIEWVNDGFSRITGYHIEEVLGKTPGSILQGPLSDPNVRARMRDAILQGRGFTEEILNYQKSGRLYWVSMSVTPIRDDKDKVIKFISVESDISARKKAEEELSAAKSAADAANRAKSDFLASMSHEIRTPMNAILGMADLLWESELTVEQRQYVEIFRTAGVNLLNLINDILDLSKVEAGQMTLEMTGFNLEELVEKVCDTMALRVHGKGVELACRLMPDVPQELMGDPLRLQQILINLMGNAIKFTEKGEIILEVGTVDGAEDGRGGTRPIRFSVRDTGIGIPSDKLSHIFETFTQVDSSVTRKYGGTGLGLAISRQLVELMGGQLTVESEMGKGSTFSFVVGFEPHEPMWKKEDGVAVNLQGLTALVVDDNATNRFILSEHLTRWGVQVTAVESGESALQEIDSGKKFDFILLDKRMPGKDGFEVADAIKNHSSLVKSTILMLTSERRADDVRKAKEYGISKYLIKPVKRNELKLSIQKSLGQVAPQAKVIPPAAAIPEAAADQRPLSILLVEDSEDNRLLVLAYLKKLPYRIDIAEDGQAAVEKVKSKSYDLVLMDMQMPVMDGYTATREIRKWEKAAGTADRFVPIIALTAHALKDDAAKSIEAGCDAHLVKPIKKERLLEAIVRYAKRME